MPVTAIPRAKSLQVSSNSQERDELSPWSVEILHGLHERALSHVLEMQKTWCTHNTCSTGPKLQAICNDSSQTGTKKDPYEKQECDRCWDEKLFPGRNATQEANIRRLCETLSSHAATFLLATCGLLLGWLIILTTILLKRVLANRKNAKAHVADPSPAAGFVKTRPLTVKNLHRHRCKDPGADPGHVEVQRIWDHSLNEISANVEKHVPGDRILIMPPAKVQQDLPKTNKINYDEIRNNERSQVHFSKPRSP